MKRASELGGMDFVEKIKSRRKRAPTARGWGPMFRPLSLVPEAIVKNSLLLKAQAWCQNGPANCVASLLPDEMWLRITEYLRSSADVRALSSTCARLFCFCRARLESLREDYGSRHPVHLSDEQHLVYAAAVDRLENVFVSGKAGTGKTFLLRAIIHAQRARLKRQVITCAYTGMAATALDGITVHSLCHLRPENDRGGGRQAPGARRAESAKARKRIAAAHTLVIDEVSMIKGGLFDYMGAFVADANLRGTTERMEAERLGGNLPGEHIWDEFGGMGANPAGPPPSLDVIMQALVQRTTRREDDPPRPKPFSGVQVIACGDFAQLPPIVKPWSPDPGEKDATLAFQSRCWNEVFGKNQFALEVAFRQSSDHEYLRLLDALRFGGEVPSPLRLQLEHRIVLDADELQRFRQSPALFFHNKDADEENARRVRSLVAKQGGRPPESYSAVRVYENSRVLIEETGRAIATGFSLPLQMQLCREAVVMCRRNFLNEHIFNGKTGHVLALHDLTRVETLCELRARCFAGRLRVLYQPPSLVQTSVDGEVDDTDEDVSLHAALGYMTPQELEAKARRGLSPEEETLEEEWRLTDKEKRDWELRIAEIAEFISPAAGSDHGDDDSDSGGDDSYARRRARTVQMLAAREARGFLSRLPEVQFVGMPLCSFLVFPCAITVSTNALVNTRRPGVRRTARRPVAVVAQLPLMLAFAMTVHKAQGATLDDVTLDLRKCTSPELVYTALTRVRSVRNVRLLSTPLWSRVSSPTAATARQFDATLARWRPQKPT